MPYCTHLQSDSGIRALPTSPSPTRYIVNNNKKNKQQTNKERLSFFSFSLLAHRVNVPTFVVTVNTKKVLQFVSGHVMVECLSKSKQ